MPEPQIIALSLGAGVQSTTMALMAAHGEITPMPDAAIFADTGAEPSAVYEHLDWLKSGNVLPFPVIVTGRDISLRDEILGASAGRIRNDARPPFFVRNRDGSVGMLRRQCTEDYKITPVRREVRRLMAERGLKTAPGVVQQWVGISIDEYQRMKRACVRYIETRWPLIEHRMSRRDCLRWLERHGYPTPPKSACTFCPYRRDWEWRRMRDEAPDAWTDAVAVDQAIRSRGYRSLIGEAYVHRSALPLDQVDLRNDAERGQPDLFGNEVCGVCGV